MLLKPIKNAAAYRVVLPAAALLEDRLATRPFTEPRPTDQSALAKRFGGGGHRNAAGFKTTFDKLKFNDQRVLEVLP